MAAEVDRVASAYPLGVAQEGLPFTRAFALMERGADGRLPTTAFELRWDDLGIVEHQHVAGLKQLRQLARRAVGNLRTVNDQQPGRIAGARGPQRDALGGKIEIEVRKAHGRRSV